MTIPIPALVRINPGAIARLGVYLKRAGFERAAVFHGDRLPQLMEDQVLPAIRREGISTVLVEELTTTAEEDLELVRQRTPAGAQVLISVGGGRVIDACKFLAQRAGLPLIAVPTIISNDGFGSPMSSLSLAGVRPTIATALPYGVVLDLEIIAQSPKRFTWSGLGDMISKITALHDWRLAFQHRQTPIDDFAVLMSQKAVQSIVQAPSFSSRDSVFLQNLASSLLLSGVAITVAGSTRPASGSEHLISHAYDEAAPGQSLHGLQVGIATYAVSLVQRTTKSAVQEVFTRSGFFDYMESEPLSKTAFIQAIKRAPMMKEDFFTILSLPESIPRLLELVDSDPILKKVLR